MNKPDIIAKLQELHHELSPSEFDLIMEEPFRLQGYDSLDEVEFIICVEKKFDVHVPDGIESRSLLTPNDVVELIIFQTHGREGSANLPIVS